MNNTLQKVILICALSVVIVSSCAMMTISSVSNQTPLSVEDAASSIHASTQSAIQAVDESASAALAVQQAYDNSVHSSNATVERLLNSVRSRCGKNDLESLKLTAEIMMLRGHVIESDLNKFPDCVTQ